MVEISYLCRVDADKQGKSCQCTLDAPKLTREPKLGSSKPKANLAKKGIVGVQSCSRLLSYLITNCRRETTSESLSRKQSFALKENANHMWVKKTGG
jgi:hypothetical protein